MEEHYISTEGLILCGMHFRWGVQEAGITFEWDYIRCDEAAELGCECCAGLVRFGAGSYRAAAAISEVE